MKPEALSSPRHLQSAVGVVLVLWQEVASINLVGKKLFTPFLISHKQSFFRFFKARKKGPHSWFHLSCRIIRKDAEKPFGIFCVV